MTNKKAMQELLSLWNSYREKGKFPLGKGKFRDVFAQLKEIRRWGAEDRLDGGVVKNWEEMLLAYPLPSTIKFAIELWYRDTEKKRSDAEKAVLNILKKYHASKIHASIHEEIAFHGLIVECPCSELQNMINDFNRKKHHDLLSAEQIRAIRTTGQIASDLEIDEPTKPDLSRNMPLPTEPPVIALLDGLPISNHPLLSKRLEINDPYDFESGYLVQHRVHGTAMASLIIHGDLKRKEPPLKSLLYVQPIMRPDSKGEEKVPEDYFFADLLNLSFQEISKINSVRVVNLSMGDLDNPFIRNISPEAKMIDYLSEKYNLLVIVSSGNGKLNFDLPITLGEYEKLDDRGKRIAFHSHIKDYKKDMRILSPAESVNAICVGASHSDVTDAPSTLTNPAPNDYPATYSRFGGGYRGAIKPDMLMVGGKQLFRAPATPSRNEWRAVWPNKNGPGLLAATPNNGCAFSSGTSQAAALTSRLCAEYLKELRNNQNLNIPPEYETVVLKAMLLHSCSWGEAGQNFYKDLKLQKKEAIKWIGYGLPQKDISSFCTDQRVTVLGYGELEEGKQSEFRFPLPNCLIPEKPEESRKSEKIKKRLTITLAWLSPIDPHHKDYRLAQLSFDAKNRKIITATHSEGESNLSKKGTVQHEVFTGTVVSKDYIKDSILSIIVSCKKEPKLQMPVKYALMVTLEIDPSVQLPIYEEVQNRLIN